MRRHLGSIAALGLTAVTVFTAAVQPASAIVGGHKSAAPYAFMGSLQRLDSPRDDLHACGVSLIAATWAITAGHCTRSAADVIDRPTSGHPKHWKVRFGSTKVNSGGELVDVAQFVQLNNRYYDRDLALLRLARPVRGAPIPIADGSPSPGTPARIMGWGVTCRGPVGERCFPQQLREADTKIRSRRSCRLSNADLCVGALDGSVGPQNMDSGGPAIVMEHGTWALVGSVEGAGEREPAVYTSITANRAWVDRYVSGRTQIPADTPFPSASLDGTVSLGGCSGSVFASARSQPSDPAMVLTNGHCAAPRPAPGGAVMNQPDRQAALIKDENGETVVRAYTTKLVYATMTGTDVAVYQLDRSYDQLADNGVTVRSVATRGPKVGRQLRVLSGTSGRDWTCTVEKIVPRLREGGYAQRHAIRYRSRPGCSPKLDDGPSQGDSGSPLVDPRTGQIVGLHNTSNGDKGKQCGEDHACEIDAQGITTSVTGRKYGQQTAALNGCLTARSLLDLSRPGCTLTEARRRARFG